MSLRETGHAVRDQYPEKFQFNEVEDYLEGEITDWKEVNVDGSMKTVLNIEAPDGVTWCIWPNTVLLRKLKQAEAEVGKKIGIEYLGMQESSKHKGRSYKMYEVYVEVSPE